MPAAVRFVAIGVQVPSMIGEGQLCCAAPSVTTRALPATATSPTTISRDMEVLLGAKGI